MAGDAPNGRICCLLGGCGCPPGGLQREQALAAELQAKAGCCPADAERAAKWVLKYFGLVPKELEAALLAGYVPIQATPILPIEGTVP